MANGIKAIERNEEPEILVYRHSVSNRLRLQPAFAGWAVSNFIIQALENEPIPYGS